MDGYRAFLVARDGEPDLDRHSLSRREEFFGRKMPAHTLVAVAALAQPEFLIEIEAVAVL